MKKDFSKVKEAFLPIAETLFSALEQTLVKINALEREFEPKILEDSTLEVFDLFREKYLEIISPIATEKLLQRGYADSVSNPPTYFYIEEAYECLAQMKTDKKAVFEFYFSAGVDEKHQFTFTKEGDIWKIDAVKYGYQDETSWHNYRL